jgi:sporulation integral membrane protein YlbJ
MARIRSLLKRLSVCLAALLMAAALIFRGDLTSAGAAGGLKLCAAVLIPSLFPFFVLSNLVSALGLGEWLGRVLRPVMRPLFGVGGAGSAALVLGLLGGYPAGAQTVASLYKGGRISRAEAGRLLRFCNNSGPAFIFGVLGEGLFHSVRLGALLYAVHAGGAVLTGILLRPREKPDERGAASAPPPAVPGFSSAFTASVRQAGSSIFQVCLFVVIFSALSSVLTALLGRFLPPAVSALAIGLLELSGGAAALAGSALPLAFRLTAASFLLGFGGLSVLAQTQALLEECGLRASGLLLPKLLQGALSAAAAYLFCVFFWPESLLYAPAFAPFGQRSAALFICLGALTLLCAAILYRIWKLTCGKQLQGRV